MQLEGATYAPANPHEARSAGIAMIYQELNLAPDLSVEDNIMLGRENRRFGLLDRTTQRRQVREALRLLGHAELHPETPVHQLSVGAQQLVEIARALVFDARVIVFDEPTSSLTAKDVEHLFAVIARLRDSGRGIIYISHFLEEVRSLCDAYTVFRDGRVAGSGRLAGASEADLVQMMVGRSVAELFPQVPHQPGEVLLSVAGLSGHRVPREVSFELRRGEILGIAGLVGAGRTELLRCLFGLDTVREGTLQVSGRTSRNTPRARIAAGLALVSEDRKGEGLAQSQSIADNLTYSRLTDYRRFGWLDLRRRRRAVRDWMSRLQVKARSPEQPVSELSGGNQQKVAIARVLHQNAEILLFDEPTRGIDVGTKAEIYRLLGEQAAAGKGVIFVSSYFAELRAVCDRIGVMSRGRLKEIRPAQNWTEPELLQAAMGGASDQ